MSDIDGDPGHTQGANTPGPVVVEAAISTAADPCRPPSSTAFKRKRLASDTYTRRKRATLACQFCRLRKTKCDNVKPVCGFCKYHNARCVYGADEIHEEPVPQTQSDRSVQQNVDQQVILDRLDELKHLLLQQHDSGARHPPTTRLGSAGPAHGTISTLSECEVTSNRSPPSTVAADPDISSAPTSHHRVTLAAARAEAILRWPALQHIISDEDREVESFLLEAESFSQKDPLSRAKLPGASGIPDEDFVPLCEKFLHHVHYKNPILDNGNLISYAKEITEHGLGWDAPSCLVLLACALASVAEPWQPSNISNLDDADAYLASSSAEKTKQSLTAAQPYYLAAKKRIGLLGSSLLDIQCLFVASIFEKCCLRALDAWFYIQQACCRLQVHLPPGSKSTCISESDADAEARLFWSLIRAEGELVAETGLRPSGLGEYIYPELFPRPPMSLERCGTESLGDARVGGTELVYRERSWFFYLAEISFWRMINDTTWLLHRRGEEYWLKDTNGLLRQYEESQRQISTWYSHLPTSLRLDESEAPSDELSSFLHARQAIWRALILRPILYCAIHRPLGQPLAPSTLVLAQECVTIYSSRILNSVDHHRHGGTWFVLRRMFSAALLILAVVCRAREGGELIPPANWPRLVKVALSTLGRWETEAPDIGRMRSTLQRVLDKVRRKMRLSVANLVDPDLDFGRDSIRPFGTDCGV